MLAKLMPAMALFGLGLSALRAGRSAGAPLDPADSYDRKRLARRRMFRGFGWFLIAVSGALAAAALLRPA